MNREKAKMDFTAIDRKKALLDAHRPLPAHTLESLRESIYLDWTYHSNGIEGNTLTLRETKVVLEGITVGGKTVREHLEAINHRDAILFLEDLVSKSEPFSEWNIKSIHQLVLKGIDDENAGRYRMENVLISGASFRPPEHFMVPQAMEQLVADYNGKWKELHPVERAAMLHGEFVKIHPFIDGNGRTARLLMNFELMKDGYPPAVIKKESRPQYYDALDTAATTGNYEKFVALVARCEEASLDLYLEVVGITPSKKAQTKEPPAFM